MEAQEIEKTDAMKAALAKFAQSLTPVDDVREREWTWRNHIAPALRKQGFENRYIERMEEKFSKAQNGVMREVERLCCGSGAIIALVGLRGTGKTSMAAEISKRRAWDRANYHTKRPEAPKFPPPAARYVKLQALCAELKPLYGNMGAIDTERLQERKEELVDAGLLIIDEKHDCNEIQFADRLLTDLLDIRYARLADTIVISNETKEGFEKSTSDSILSRLDQHGRIIACKWDSFRIPQA